MPDPSLWVSHNEIPRSGRLLEFKNIRLGIEFLLRNVIPLIDRINARSRTLEIRIEVQYGRDKLLTSICESRHDHGHWWHI